MIVDITTKLSNSKPLVLIMVLLFLALSWITIVLLLPLEIWHIPVDGPIMALANGANIDHWLYGNERTVGNPQASHPGIFSQILFWIIYKISAPGFADNPLDRFLLVLEDPAYIWIMLQIYPLLVSSLAIIFIYTQIKTGSSLVLFCCLLSPFASINTFHMGIYVPYNESLSILIMAISFPLLLKWLQFFYVSGLDRFNKSHTKVALFLGFTFTLLYLHKLTYLIFAFCFMFTLLIMVWRKRVTIKNFILISIISIFTFFTFSALALIGFFGFEGATYAGEVHLGWLFSSGLLGASTGLFSLETIWQSLKYMMGDAPEAFKSDVRWSGEPYLLGLLAMLTLGVLYRISTLRLKSTKHDLEKSWTGLFIIMVVCVGFITVTKRYSPYYVIVITSILPFGIFWLLEHSGPLIRYLFLGVIMAGVISSTGLHITDRKNNIAYALDVNSDVIKLEKMFGQNEKPNLWAYRIIHPNFQYNFTTQFSSIRDYRLAVNEIMPNTFEVSPWHKYFFKEDVYHDLNMNQWHYVVFDRRYIPLINNEAHQWIRSPNLKKIELDRLTAFTFSTDITTQLD